MIRRLMFTAFLLATAASAFAASTLNGAGATFPYPIYSKWFNEYHKLHPEVPIYCAAVDRQLGRGSDAA